MYASGLALYNAISLFDITKAIIPQIKQTTIDIALYHLHCRISPRNIPDLRVKRYENAKEWLKFCANGDLTPKLTVKPEKAGMRIRYGGNTKNINQY